MTIFEPGHDEAQHPGSSMTGIENIHAQSHPLIAEARVGVQNLAIEIPI
jgi:hypothetical protein